MQFCFIDWQPSMELFKLGNYPVRWYSMCWVIGILGAYFLVRWLFKDQVIDPVPEKKKGKFTWNTAPVYQETVPTGKFDPLIFYCFIGVVLGARLGHCLFYEPAYYLGSVQGVVEMFIPIHYDVFPSQWHFTGYTGLASHGGTIGLFLALLLYIRWSKLSAWTVLDMIGLAAPLTACFIRLGNLMNSEIIGSVTDVPWAFIFHTNEALVDGLLVPRHPSQLYEAVAYLLIFIVGWALYKFFRAKDHADVLPGHKGRVGTGFYFGFCLATIFLFRFFIEFLKEVQGGADDGSTLLDMGQMLSIPFVLVGLWCVIKGLRTTDNGQRTADNSASRFCRED